MNAFEALGVSTNVVKALVELGFEEPTGIQGEAIPKLLSSNSDFIGLAQTGTGKTAAFGIPLLDYIDTSSKFTQGLVLAPTRELVQQISENLEKFAKFTGIKIQTVYGGTSISQQIRQLKRSTPHIVVATPGRLIDIVDRKVLSIDSLTHFVLDEADEMLNMGFKEEIDHILSYVDEGRKTWLFSATMPKEIERIINNYMENPQEVRINPKNIVNKNISHQFALVKGRDKQEALKRIIDINPDLYGITFCRTKADTQRIAAALLERGYQVDALNGDLSQSQRDQVMTRFKTKKLNMLLATDVAARGIDVNNITHVVHFDLPDDMEYYTHRSGRTARAGNKGESIALIAPSEKHKIRRIEQKLKLELSKYKIPTKAELENSVKQSWVKKVKHFVENAQFIDNDIQEAIDALQDISKEDLIKGFLLNEISDKSKDSSGEDINFSGNNDRNEGPSNRPSNQFYINAGSMDGLDKSELIQLISDLSGVKKKMIGNLTMQKNGSIFKVDPEELDKLKEKISGVEYNGREIIIKRDGSGRSDSRRGKGQYGGRGRSGGSFNRKSNNNQGRRSGGNQSRSRRRS